MSSDIGFAEISEIYRNERNSKIITKIRIDFYSKAEEYLAELENNYKELGKNPTSAQAMMLQDEIKKVNKRMEQIYDHRERKISLAALSGACGSEPPKYLTTSEKELYSSLVDVLKHYRRCPSDAPPPEALTRLVKEEKKIIAKPEIVETVLVEPSVEIEEARILQVLEDVPSFAGADRVYNLKKADIVTMPVNFADVLVARGAAKVLDG